MRLERAFFERDVLEVAPALIGSSLVRVHYGTFRYIITEVEAYRGIEDKASHARFGKTTRNQVMFEQGGLVYVYLIYGMHWMLNIVTGPKNLPQAILIRGISGISGPGKLSRALSIDHTFYSEDLTSSDRIWLEPAASPASFTQKPRYGIDYATEPWKNMPWRYIMVQAL
jgi:DNA-3-methyladenine glycosylase